MYSVVLATMITASATTPAWHRQSCYGCTSCYSGYSGYSGYSCFGCTMSNSCHRRLVPVYYGCYGCSSCSYCSGCTTYSYHGCTSCTVVHGCTGCSGGAVVMPTIPKVMPVPPANPELEALRKEVQMLRDQLKKKGEKLPPPPKPPEEVVVPVKISRVTVTLPADARLWVENVECPLTSAVRSFDTPALRIDQNYFYNLTMQVVRDGQTIHETQRVPVVPGEQVNVNFSRTGGAIASTR